MTLPTDEQAGLLADAAEALEPFARVATLIAEMDAESGEASPGSMPTSHVVDDLELPTVDECRRAREVRARLIAGAAEVQYPAEAIIEGPNIVIRVPISAIPVAFDAWPDAPRNEEGDALYVVTDAATFAKGIVRYLNAEEEDGTTRIHVMFDGAMSEALEQGEEGVEEVATPRASGG